MENLVENYSYTKSLAIGIPLVFLFTVVGLLALTLLRYCRHLVIHWNYLENRKALSYNIATKKINLVERFIKKVHRKKMDSDQQLDYYRNAYMSVSLVNQLYDSIIIDWTLTLNKGFSLSTCIPLYLVSNKIVVLNEICRFILNMFKYRIKQYRFYLTFFLLVNTIILAVMHLLIPSWDWSYNY